MISTTFFSSLAPKMVEAALTHFCMSLFNPGFACAASGKNLRFVFPSPALFFLSRRGSGSPGERNERCIRQRSPNFVKQHKSHPPPRHPPLLPCPFSSPPSPVTWSPTEVCPLILCFAVRRHQPEHERLSGCPGLQPEHPCWSQDRLS